MDKWTKELMLFLSIILLISVIYSTFILSLSMFGFVFLALFYKKGDFRFWENRAFLFTTFLFFLFVLSGVNSDNTSDWVHHMRMKLPFLVLPIAFYKLPRINKRDYFLLHNAFLVIIFLSAFPVLYYYITHFEQVQIALGLGQPIPTPLNHTKYSIFVSYSIISGFILYSENFFFKYKWEKNIVLLMSVLLVVFIHILAVRSGIVALYITLIGISLHYTINKGRYKFLILLTAFLLVVPFVAFKTIPSLNKRMHYMAYDYNKFINGEDGIYSDSDRIKSLQVGFAIFKNHPVIGVGIGDLKDNCREEYKSIFGPDKKVLYPHNQYLFILAGAGILGIVVFLIGFIGPFLIEYHYRNYFLLALFLIYASSFMVDNILERSSSAAFLAYFLCIGIGYCDNIKKTEKLI